MQQLPLRLSINLSGEGLYRGRPCIESSMCEGEPAKRCRKLHALYDGDGREALHGGKARDDQIPALFPPYAISPVFYPLPLRQLHATLPRGLTKSSKTLPER